MPIATVLKRLRLKMASMQSPRSQCCCCAVGIFACMFGFFMLSAGICILLNLTFMEVDTSGLPPDLQNEDGKKVVGILLICVAVAALGLSMTVSIVYFFICGKEDDRKTNKTNGTHGGGQPKGSNNSFQTNSSTVLNGKPKSQRSRESSQVSIRSQSSRRISSPDTVGAMAMASSSGHRHAKRKSHNKQKHRLGPKMRPNLPPHAEEDPESARSVADLKQGKSTFYVKRSEDDDIEISSQEYKVDPPKIVVDSFSSSSPKPNFEHTNSIDQLISETAFIEEEEDTEKLKSSTYVNDSTDTSSPANLESKIDHQPSSAKPEILFNKTTSEFDYKNPNNSALDDLSIDSEISSVSHQNSEVARTYMPIPMPSEVAQSKPVHSVHSGVVSAKIGDRHHPDLDLQSDSRSSFNSAFSMDGGDPDQSEQSMKDLLVERL